MLSNQFMSNYNNDLTQLSTVQQQLSSGKSFSKPSDDPVKYSLAISYHTDADVNSQYASNVTSAISWMSTSTSATTTLVNSMNSIKSLVTQAASSQSTSTYQDIATQVKQIVSGMVDTANTQIGGRYIFAGQNDQKQPFSQDSTTGVVTYSGTYDGQSGNATAGTISMQVSPGNPNQVRDKVNVDGVGVFGSLNVAGQPQTFTDLNQIVTDIQNGDSTAITNDLTTLATDTDQITNAQTQLGAKQSAYQSLQSTLTTDSTNIQTNLSNNENVNVAQADVDFQSATNTFQDALAVGAKILPMSLVNYLS
jgi:flagellar hook-associated protein 3 FlgL